MSTLAKHDMTLLAERPEDLPVYLRPGPLVALVLLLTVAKLLAGMNAHFVEDEAYYRLWGLNPAFGYYDHPPMIAWWIWAGQKLLGDTVLAVRLMVILSAGLGSLFLWRATFLLAGVRAAGWAVLFLNASFLVGIGGILATPDAPSVFFWGLAFWALAELVTSKNPTWWLAVGMFAGLGLTSKYSVLFLGAGIALWLLAVPSARVWFRSWQLWAGGAIAVLCFAPVLVWNDLHEWVSFTKQFGRAGRGSLTGKYVFEFIGAVLGLMNPFIALPALLGAGSLIGLMRRGDARAALVLLSVLPFLAYLLFHSLHARVQANWPAPLFPAFALMAGWYVAGRTVETSARFAKLWRRWSLAAVAIGLALATLVQMHAVVPFTGALARKDPTFQLRGWQEVGDTVRALAQKEKAAFVLTTSYGLTGQLDFLLRQDLPVAQVTERIRYVMGEAPGLDLFQAPGLYVTSNRRDRHTLLEGRFAEVRQIAEFPRQVDGVELERMRVYLVKTPTSAVLDPVDLSGKDG